MEALFAYYTLSRREREIEHEHLEMYDSDGTQSMLFGFEQGAGLPDRRSSSSPICGPTPCGRRSVPICC